MAIPQIKFKKPRKDETAPVPAVALGTGPFEINAPPRGLGGGSSPKGKFLVPCGNSEPMQAIRAHEYSHLAIHRVEHELMETLRAENPSDVYQAALDNIVNEFARASGVPIVKKLPAPRMAPHADNRVRAMRLLQHFSISTRAKDGVLSADHVAYLRDTAKQLQQAGKELANGKPLATEKLRSIFRAISLRFSPEPAPRPEPKPRKYCYSDWGKFSTLGGKFLGDLMKQRSDLNRLKESAQRDLRFHDTSTTWCDMAIVRDSFNRSLKRQQLAAKRTPGFVGAFRMPLRALLPAFDGKAWSVKQRLGGGTILVDASGSMGMQPQHILALLETAPMATVASYSMESNKGELHIHAVKGRYTENPEICGSGNGVDGPALRWLMTQKRPRVWITDGGVTGQYDHGHPLLSRECIHLCLRGDILAIGSIPQYLELAEASASR
jgi:hypothetical protein